MTANLKTDGATEMCFCFYEDRMMGKQRAALTIKAELFIAMYPQTRRALFLIITLDARGLSRHIIISVKNLRVHAYKHKDVLYMHFQVTTSKKTAKKHLGAVIYVLNLSLMSH